MLSLSELNSAYHYVVYHTNHPAVPFSKHAEYVLRKVEQAMTAQKCPDDARVVDWIQRENRRLSQKMDRGYYN